MKEFFIVYETTNIINGKKYRGIHKTFDLGDGYLGSGIALKYAFKKYGKENFKKEIIEYCNSCDELIEKEKIYVDDNWIKNTSNYNLKTGGQSAGILSNESKKKLSETLKKKYESGELMPCKPNLGKPMKMETKNKISETLKTKYKIQEHPSKGKTANFGENNGMFGKDPWNKGSKGVQKSTRKGIKIGPDSEETKLKKSISAKERYKTREHHSKGKPSWNKGIEMPKIECPYCGILVDKSNGKKWHFDNCKNKKEE
jgi:hypothetical protein